MDHGKYLLLRVVLMKKSLFTAFYVGLSANGVHFMANGKSSPFQVIAPILDGVAAT